MTTGTLWCLCLAWSSSLLGDRLRSSNTFSDVLNRAAGALFIFWGSASRSPNEADAEDAFHKAGFNTTTFAVAAFFGMTGGTIAGALLCKSHGILAVIGGAVGGALGGLLLGILYGAAIVLLCALWSVFWQLITGRLNPDYDNSKRDHKDDTP